MWGFFFGYSRQDYTERFSAGGKAAGEATSREAREALFCRM